MYQQINNMTQKPTILIIDDDTVSLDILLNQLDNKYNIKVTTDPEESIQIVKNSNIDLILLDIMMPKINGFELCEIFKSTPETESIPIIFITAKNNIEDKYKGFTLGAVDYLVKPFHITELMVRVNTHIQLHTLQQSLEKKVQIQTQKNLINNELLIQKSKQSEIGDMIMHIAHQWKQPISSLGSIILYHQLYFENNANSFDEKKLVKDLEKSSNIIEFMSKTVETFQNFFLPAQNEQKFSLFEAFDDALKIVDATYYFHGFTIKVEKNIDTLINGKKNEYSQVVLVILNNVKNIFLQRKTQDPLVTITIDQKDNKSLLSVEDNAGGIDTNIIDDIFLPYISGTKTSGLGLYMAQEIIQKLNGNISAENINKGAKFTIEV